MPTPTQQDIDRLRVISGDPAKVEKFERHFGVKAADYLRSSNLKVPTERDIYRLQEVSGDPEKVKKFEAVFGPADKYLTEGADLRPTMKPQSRLEKISERQRKDMSIWSRMHPMAIGERVAAAAVDVGEQIFDSDNLSSSIKGAGDVLSRVPKIVTSAEHMGELGRGLYQGAVQIPGGINDLALAGVDLGAQLLTGAEALPEGYAEDNPFGSAQSRGMFDEYGNAVSQAVGGVDAFDFEEPETDEGKTARRIGEFVGGGSILGAAARRAPGVVDDLGNVTGKATTLGNIKKTVAPSAGGAVGAETARYVAPDEPGWQVFGGALGTAAPAAVTRGVPAVSRAITAAPRAVAAAVRPLTQSGREQIVGNALYEAAGRKVPEIKKAPLEGMELTLGQATNNEGTLALEKMVAKSQEGIGQFKDRLEESHTVARKAVADLRGGGAPDDVRNFADAALSVVDRNALDVEFRASSGRTPTQASIDASGRIDSARSAMRSRRNEMWRAKDLMSEEALVPVADIRGAMDDFMNTRSKFAENKIPSDVSEGMKRLGEYEPLAELQAIRSDLGNRQRGAIQQGKMADADIYGGLADAIGNRLDNMEFADAGIQEAYQAARAISRLEAEMFKKPNEMREVLGRNKAGGDKVSAEQTLGRFVKPGPAGANTIDQVLAVDRSPEMVNLIGDYMVGNVPQGLVAAQNYMSKFAPLLEKVPDVRARIQGIVDARQTAQALKDSPISIFAGKEPAAAVKAVISHPDRIRIVRQLKSMLGGERKAWAGFKAAYADEIMRRIQSSIERDAQGNMTLKPGVANKFYMENADLTREILEAGGEATLRNVADALEMTTRTSRAGYPGGSDTFSMLTGYRFIDLILAKYLESQAGAMGSGAAAGSAGLALAGPLGGGLGAVAGVGGHLLFANARAQVTALLREALLDPAKGRALMLKASQSSLKSTPRSIQKKLERYIDKPSRVRARTAAIAQRPVDESPKKNRIKPGTVVRGWRYNGGDPKDKNSWTRE